MLRLPPPPQKRLKILAEPKVSGRVVDQRMMISVEEGLSQEDTHETIEMLDTVMSLGSLLFQGMIM